jgi:HAD superfamily hydrolase (TIGR01484 family)
MSFDILATDYDGTIASQGIVDDATLAALDRFRESGRRLILVTGRELDDLARTFDHFERFELIVAENGALLFWPATGAEKILAESAPAEFVKRLADARVERLSIGRSIVATVEPYDKVVLEAIKDLGLELQVIFNKGAVMVLPSGVNKATGLKAALKELGVRPDSVVGIGDAENDHAFLECCGLAVAVGNALPSLKERAHFTTSRGHGAGVAELIERWLTRGLDDLVPAKAVS